MTTRALLALAGCSLLAAMNVANVARAASGPDVIVGDIPDMSNWGTVTVNGQVIRAYSVGTTSCNIGNQNILWQSANNLHPVIGGNLYRMMNGRFEQLGQSWLKHGFTALTGSVCAPCPSGSQGGPNLNPGCSDPYTASLNGSQTRLGPKSDVDAAFGYYPYPPTLGYTGTTGTSGNAIFKRLQVNNNDVTPTLNTGAVYFVEGQYVTSDDALAGNNVNNVSYRRVTLAAGSGTDQTLINRLTPAGATIRMTPAIMAWRDFGGGVAANGTGIADPSVRITTVTVPGDGVYYVGSKVTNNQDGTWTYEYAVENSTSHRSAQAFAVPTGRGVTLTNVGFRDVAYHSGEPVINTPWTVKPAYGTVGWATDQYTGVSPYPALPGGNTRRVEAGGNDRTANALRWGTMYNFRFTANVAPTTGTGTLSLFRPATAVGVNMPTVSFLTNVPTMPSCQTDWDRSGETNANDISAYINDWYADLVSGNTSAVADWNNSGETDANDLSDYLNSWFAAFGQPTCQ